jgi:hypothetical protein
LEPSGVNFGEWRCGRAKEGGANRWEAKRSTENTERENREIERRML